MDIANWSKLELVRNFIQILSDATESTCKSHTLIWIWYYPMQGWTFIARYAVQEKEEEKGAGKLVPIFSNQENKLYHDHSDHRFLW